MNIIRATHQSAMDINTLAEVSKAKGFISDAKEFYKKAYELEKKAALMSSSATEDTIPHFILMRSSAALAYKAELFKESEHMIQMCLSENPPSWIVDELNEITTLINQAKTRKIQATSFNLLQIEGTLTIVNADENMITIKDTIQEQSFPIVVPKDLLIDIVKKFWLNKVKIEAKLFPFGVLVLEKINHAV